MLVKRNSLDFKLHKQLEKEKIDRNHNPNRTLTEKEKRAAEELKQRIIAEQKFLCGKCNNELTGLIEIAHRIHKSKYNIRKYGWDIINHRINLIATHKDCNSGVLVGQNIELEKEIVKQIREVLC